MSTTESKITDCDEGIRSITLTGCGGYEKLRIDHTTITPVIDDGSVLVRVKVCGVNFADIYNRQGLPGNEKLIFPLVAGLECAGIVEKVGKAVQSIKAGDRVLCFSGKYGGMWSELVVVDEDYCHRIPDAIPWKDAGCLLVNYCTAYSALFYAGNIRSGDKIMIDSAAGGVGWATTQLARSVKDVEIVGCASEHKHEAVMENGVDHVVDSRSTDVNDELKRLSPTGYDLIIDMQSGNNFTQRLGLLTDLGRIVHVGGFEMMTGETLNMWQLMKAWWQLKNIRVIDLIMANKSVSGVNLSTLARNKPHVIKDVVRKILKLYSDGIIRPRIDGIYGFEEVIAASRRLTERQNVGKVLLAPCPLAQDLEN